MTEASFHRSRERGILTKVEDALISALNQDTPTWLDIERWPENPRDYDFAGKGGVVLVHYAGSRYADPDGLSLNQARAMSWALVVKTRSLDGERGAYDVLEDIRQSLQGLSIEGGGPIRMVRDDLVSEVDGVWQWEIIVALPIPAVARRRPAPAALFKPVTQTSNNAA